jgi:hypothetical protein
MRARAASGSFPWQLPRRSLRRAGAGGQLLRRVDVAKGVGFVVERDFGEAQARVPGVDLAPALFEKAREVRKHAAANEREHRMRLLERACYRDVQRLRIERPGEPRDEVGRQERRVARRRRDERRRRRRQAGVQSRERPGEAADRVTDDRMAEGGIALDVAVRVDDQRTDLRREPREHVRDERLSVEFDQPLVDHAHPATLPAREHEAGDVAGRDRHPSITKRSAPVNSR